MSASIPRLERFRITRRLGEGGMGVVYEAFDEERGVPVALKMIRQPELLGADALARFKREFRSLSDVRHPNLVSLGELISQADEWFFTMEIVEGVDLITHVRTDRLAARSNPSATARELTDPRSSRGAEVPARAASNAFDEARLRDSFRQLAAALSALHGAGMVHRDLKPSNVRVTPAGRVVLLDFGLVVGLEGDDIDDASTLLGTPAYMAPEQAGEARIGPEADWYAFGMMLYEALTGVTAFEGGGFSVIERKQNETPQPPSTRVPVPDDLDALCAALLDRDPERRAGASMAMRVLGEERGSLPRSSGSTPAAASPFVGRDAELAILGRAFEDVRKNHGVAVLLSGESGVGKTRLVREMTRTLVEGKPALVLSGRCYERETVPYKAFDGVVDALTSALVQWTAANVEAILPPSMPALVHAFPVLRRIEAVAGLPKLARETLDPIETRTRAFAALRALLARIAEALPMVVTIDDLQWADRDSLLLLADVLRPPEAPRILLVATARPIGEASELEEAVLAAFSGELRRVHLEPLGEPESRKLATLLLDRAQVASNVRSQVGSKENAEAIAREAGGHPLFIDALVRFSASGASSGAHAPRLDEALWEQIRALDPSVRELIELLAVAAAPVQHDVLAAAAGGDRSAVNARIADLRASHLVATTGVRGTDTVELYHDKLRITADRRIDASTRAQRHHRLALALERAAGAGANDAEALSIHWRGAGEREKAARYAAVAADEAMAALAFARAARLYREAVDGWPAGERDARRAVVEKLGNALASAGRGALAAAAYGDAAADAPPALALDLRRRAAEQLLRSGHFDEGLASLRQVLSAIGMRLPKSLVAALVGLLLLRAILFFRGLSFERRDASQISTRDRMRLDACWSASFCLAVTEPVRGAAFQARNLLLALRAGDDYRVARALSIEATYLALDGVSNNARVADVVKRATELAERSQEAHARGWAQGGAAGASYLQGRYKECLALSDRAMGVFRGECVGFAWELDSLQSFALWSLAQMGELAELQRRQPIYLREALERGDLYGGVLCSTGDVSMAAIARGDPEGAKAAARAAMGRWSKQGFHLEHFYELVTKTYADLYSGHGRRAHARITTAWPALRRSMLRRVESVRVQTTQMRARAALAAARAENDDAKKTHLVLAAARDARALERERSPVARALATLVRAGIAAVRRAPDERVVPLLRQSAAALDAVDMCGFAVAARRVIGERIGGDEGRALVADSDAWAKRQRVKDARAMTTLLASGLYESGFSASPRSSESRCR